MRILHYSLGLPPYRSGGLTKYSIDLMTTQVQKRNEVALLYPGQINILGTTVIKKNKDFIGISVYEIINPLPVPLLGGVTEPESFMKPMKGEKTFVDFLKKINPDVIHIHTLMGIHFEFFEAAKRLGIKIIFTSHDYYGICPKVNLIESNGNICESFEDGQKCVACNSNAYSLPMIYIMQSHGYKKFKSSILLNKIKSIKKSELKSKDIKSNTIKKKEDKVDKLKAIGFSKLRNYYISMLEMVDKIHFNSTIAKEQFEKYVSTKGRVIEITHSDISDNRKLKLYNEKKPLQIGFLGPIEEYKGFPMLRRSLNRLLDSKEDNWHLHVFGNDGIISLNEDADFISFHGKYRYEDLIHIFNKIDVLVIPSLWKETFGFIGLEAMANGVPAIVTSNVGFKDVVEKNDIGYIVQPNEIALAKLLQLIINDRKILQSWNENIYNQDFSALMLNHNAVIEKLYEEI